MRHRSSIEHLFPSHDQGGYMDQLTLLQGEIDSRHWSPPEDFDYESMQQSIEAISDIETGVQYWIGDALIFAEKRFGDQYLQFIPEDKAETWRQYKWVCERVNLAMRRQMKSFAHARSIAKLDYADQQKLAKEINLKEITSRDLQKEVRKRNYSNKKQQEFPTDRFRIIYYINRS